MNRGTENEDHLARLTAALREAQEEDLKQGAHDLWRDKEAADEREAQAESKRELSDVWIPGFLQMMRGHSVGPKYSGRGKGWPVAIMWESRVQAWTPESTVIVSGNGRLLQGYMEAALPTWWNREYGSRGERLEDSRIGERRFTSIAESRTIDPLNLLRLNDAFVESAAAYLARYGLELRWPGLSFPPS